MCQKEPSQSFTMDIGGLKRELKLFPVSEDLQIAAFILFGDVEITEHAAKELLKRAPEFDLLLTAEAKSIPLIHEMARQAGQNDYIVARKGVKVYMEEPIAASVTSITTKETQTIYLGKDEAERVRGKRILIIDDVISTGESLKAMEELTEKAGGIIAGKMAVLAEGESYHRDDIIALAQLPLFDGQGRVMDQG